MSITVHDARVCLLGEGPLWHPERQQLFWFDILNKSLLTQQDDKAVKWQFDDTVSAAGWVDRDTLFMASATGLWRLDLTDGSRTLICPLEGTNAITRSNDGRADPWGGFWIGTMGFNAEPGAGAIYRFYQGTLKKLFADITVSNAICFAPDRSCAYYSDTRSRQIMQVPLDRSGWPSGSATVFVDLRAKELNPDGAVTDADGTLWVAQWGAGRVAAYDTGGQFLTAFDVPAQHTTCPAFGGEDMSTLFVTSAADGVSTDVVKNAPHQGKTFAIKGVSKGLAEPRVLL